MNLFASHSFKICKFMLWGLIMTACIPAPANPTSERAEGVPTATITAASADSPAVTPLATYALPPATPTVTPDTLLELGEPWPTAATPSQTPTTTPASTLAPAQEGIFLATLLATNGGCALPCWWGVTPGLTGAQAARDLFAAQGIDDWVLSNASPPYATMALGYSRSGSAMAFRDVNVMFWLEDGLVYFIGVEGRFLDEALRPIAVDLWAPYGPAAMLSQYGQPALVEVAPINNSPYYRLIFSYDALGVELVYVLPIEIQADGRERVCLDLASMDHIGLALYQVDQASRAPLGLLANRPDNHTSWESTTGLSRADLSELLLDGAAQPCFGLP